MGLWLRMLLVTGLPEEVSPLLPAHRDHLRELKRRGKLRIAGELGRGDGFFDLFEAVDRHDAEAITRESPLVEAGQATWTLREWSEIELD